MKKIEIVKGTTSPIYEIGLKGVATLDSNYTGTSAVYDLDGNEEFSNAMDTNDSTTRFLGFLEPDDTDSLGYATYKWVMTVLNSTTTPEIKKEYSIYIKIVEEGTV